MNVEKWARLSAWALRKEGLYVPSGLHAAALTDLGGWLDDAQPESLLDVGCGIRPEIVAGLCTDRGIAYTGVDVQAGGTLIADAHDLPFEDNSFDIVLSREGLEHLLCPYLALAEMMRVTRRHLIVALPEDSPWCGNSPGHLWVLSREAWRHVFRLLGLEEERFAASDVTATVDRPQIEWRWLLSKPTGWQL